MGDTVEEARFLTRGGVEVIVRGRPQDAARKSKTGRKVMCERASTGGHHGLLWLDQLKPLNREARLMKAAL